jgi:hypothetical protein
MAGSINSGVSVDMGFVRYKVVAADTAMINEIKLQIIGLQRIEESSQPFLVDMHHA